MIGPAATYASSDSDGDFLRGYVRSGYISDHGDRLADAIWNGIPQNRGYFEWEHKQRIHGHIDLQGSFSYWSDPAIVREYRPRWFYSQQEPDSFLEGSYAGENYVLSAFARLSPNRRYLDQKRQPEIRFDLLPTAIGGGVYERFNASFAELEQQDAHGGAYCNSDPPA